MNYFMRLSEALMLKQVNESQVISFLNQYIITRFGVPISLVFDNETYFSSLKLIEFSLEKGIKIKYVVNYYPQGNGLVESTNKNLIHIIKRIITDHPINWHNALSDALWEDRVTPKDAIGNSPFLLVCGKEDILPPNIFLPYLQLAQSEQETPSTSMQHQIDTLLKLEEEWKKIQRNSYNIRI